MFSDRSTPDDWARKSASSLERIEKSLAEVTSALQALDARQREQDAKLESLVQGGGAGQKRSAVGVLQGGPSGRDRGRGAGTACAQAEEWKGGREVRSVTDAPSTRFGHDHSCGTVDMYASRGLNGAQHG